MSDQNEPIGPNTGDKRLPRIFWLFAAFSPIGIMLAMAGDLNQPVINKSFIVVVVFGINPVLSIFSCYHLLCKADQNKSLNIVSAILLGIVIASLNPFIALFAACAMHPPRF
jgi:hypothetical protein